jgi:hypothetical protein
MSAWTQGRSPLEDAAAEDARVDAYWQWLEASTGRDSHGAFAGYAIHAPLLWRKLETADQADHEAWHMRHSIGHSWDKYSALGDIYSLRSEGDTPEATVLVIEGLVVHAREHRNARLSPENQAHLLDFCRLKGFKHQPDDLPFDFHENDGCPNTMLRALRRPPGGGKEFHEVVFAGRANRQQVEDLVLAMISEIIVPAGSCLPVSFGDLELALVRHVDVPADQDRDIDELFEDMIEAAKARQIVFDAELEM